MAACLRELVDLSIVLPCQSVRFQGHLHCTSSCPQVVFCAWYYLLLVGLRPLPEDSLCALWLSARFLWPSLRPRVCESSRLSLWFFPFRGPPPIASIPQFEAASESLTHSIPRSFLVESLSTYALGLADALWLCPERALRLFFASVSFVDPVRNVAPLAQCLC